MEIVEWSSKDSYACCTLASINLKKFLKKDSSSNDSKYFIDHDLLHKTVQSIVENLDNIIDENEYPVKECVDNSKNYRPIGIGVQALSEVFMMMRIPFISDEAKKVDIEIFETIYHAAITASVRLARIRGSFVGFEKSPAAQGKLAPDLWKFNQDYINSPLRNTPIYSDRYNFNELRNDVRKFGLRNSLHIALMPTVSTSQILGNTESIEPMSANIYVKSTLAGKFTLSNQILIRHLIELGIWNKKIEIEISNNNGSVQGIAAIPAKIQEIYKTVYEMSQAEIMNRAAIRQAFVDQSQSLNINLNDNTDKTLRGVFIHGNKIGLKTTSYYTRVKPKIAAMKNNIAQYKKLESVVNEDEMVCNMEEGCTMCSS
jgi:ribonucleoside-diphosphate reductase alpha chain